MSNALIAIVKPAATYRGFVLTDRRQILVQLPAANEWGFALYSDDQSWPGGFGIATSWSPVKPDELGERLQERCADLEWLLE